jgi:RNA polymerase sigma factor (sigma-70 family)
VVKAVEADKSPDLEVGRASFGNLYQAHWVGLVRLGYALCGSLPLAEDIVHDAFVRLVPSLERVEDPLAYLRKAVLNGVRDNYRHLRVERRHPPAPSLPSALPEVDETWAALQALPTRYRDVLVLRYYSDLRVEDVAEVLGCPVGTAKSLIHRGLEKLKERLNDH